MKSMEDESKNITEDMALDTSSLDKILQRYIRSDPTSIKLQAASFLIKDKNGETIYSKALGDLTFAPNSPPFTQDSVFSAMSLTKLVTAISVVQLVEKDMISLDANLSTIIPELANKKILHGFGNDGTPILTDATNPITLRTLLTHTSGFTYAPDSPLLTKWAKSTNHNFHASPPSLGGFTYPLLFNPGDGWVYGIGLDWAARIVEVLTHTTYESYLQAHIFAPLGMRSSTVRIWDHPELTSRQADIGSRPKNVDGEMVGRPLIAKTPLHRKDLEMHRGGGALYTTANNYAVLLASLLSSDGRILKGESVEELLRPQLADARYLKAVFDGPDHGATCPEFPIGLGVNHALAGVVNVEDVVKKRPAGTVAWSGASGPRWLIDRRTGIAALLVVQVMPFEDEVAVGLYNEIEEAMYAILRKRREGDCCHDVVVS
ncbi:beta-lactamase/transpeptidase-like protein [Microthyrium microscopicum]|uniref:Beta-lactamase/transpeptidase-like protein n=1 Tax=Microthyrium microscopicum TaxID=703497 RepID=A0A6A6U055_9PEZI|nr:beta-lactamase/transpeptidase-like protein [Microthyrium microscopicum]